jgi:hypothetical protein
MKSYLHLVIAAGLLALILTLALSRQKSAPEEVQARDSNLTSVPVVGMAPEAIEMDAELHHRHTEERVAALQRREAAQERYARAAAQSGENRRFLNRSYAEAWKSVIETNRPLYLKLRAKAAESKNGETPCTICDGKSYLPYCIACETHPGKCTTCQGHGRTVGDEVCPTCLGSGKCFTCTGHTKMLCPYCDDGDIRADGRMPNFHLSE